jgi:broad specificity phosphatase PhoE
MAPTTILLIRHADTEHKSRLRGWYDPPLSRQGRIEAEMLRQRLAAWNRPVAIYSSPLRRAAETVAPLAEAFGLDLKLLELLREIDCGAMDGRELTEIQARHPDLWERNSAHDDDHFRWPGGESYAEFRARALAAMRSLAAAHPGGRVWAGTHTGVITQAVGALHGTSPARWDAFRAGHASITELQWNGETGVVVSFDDRSHLDSIQPAGEHPRAG